MSRIEADGIRKINVAFLKKEGYFSGQRFGFSTISWTAKYGGDKGNVGLNVFVKDGKKYLQIAYTETYMEEKKNYDYEVSLTTTPCNYGGVRYWFFCPTPSCRKRVGMLYLAGRDGFACRHCYNYLQQ